jgi:hypothetical protein
MRTLICALVAFVSTLFRSRLALQLENVALRHQLTVYQRTTQTPTDQHRRPYSPVLALARLVGVAKCSGHSPAQDCDCLAT